MHSQIGTHFHKKLWDAGFSSRFSSATKIPTVVIPSSETLSGTVIVFDWDDTLLPTTVR